MKRTHLLLLSASLPFCFCFIAGGMEAAPSTSASLQGNWCQTTRFENKNDYTCRQNECC
jgi:hypothetical protein